MKTLYIFILYLLTISITTNAQNELDSINNILVGDWLWTECNPAPYECVEQPSDNLSRIIQFLAIDNSDSLEYNTYKNETLIANGKIKLTDINIPTCLVMADVIFGGENVVNEVFTKHRITIENDTIIKFMLGDKKSGVSYRYKKKELISGIDEQNEVINQDILDILYSHGKIILTIDYLNTSKNLFLKLANVQGIIIYQHQFNNNELIINTNNIPSGIYLGLLFSDNYLLDTQKIMISGE